MLSYFAIKRAGERPTLVLLFPMNAVCIGSGMDLYESIGEMADALLPFSRILTLLLEGETLGRGRLQTSQRR